MRTDSIAALLWNPINMSLKVFYVLDIMIFEDGPIVQLYLAVISQVVGLLLFM